MSVLAPGQIKQSLREHRGFSLTDFLISEPKKSLGQHWLYDDDVLEAMCDAVEVDQGELVLEIGPGLGTLTSHLLGRDARVMALEFDEDLARSLSVNLKKLGADQTNLQIRAGDIRTFNFLEMETNYKVCANIPYYLTSNLVRLLCDTENKPSIVAMLVQKEVAERVVASDKKMSILSCFAHFYFECSKGGVVPAQLFTPPPKVDSQILIMKRRDSPLFEVDTSQFFKLVKAGFSGKRKTLRNSLSAGLRVSKDATEGLLQLSGIDHSRRAENLSMIEWKSLYDKSKVLDVLSN